MKLSNVYNSLLMRFKAVSQENPFKTFALSKDIEQAKFFSLNMAQNDE